MAKEELIEMDGVVTDVLPDSRFKVQLDNGHEVMAYSAGKMKKHRIRIMVGDRVDMEMTPYDLTKARITYRHKVGGPPGPVTGGGNRPPPRQPRRR
ncbi:translation initiation factor IF-1 [Rhodospirillum rubrum]|uniref:Translation initiation factor IF-1 n=3 Tax=Rhodospirillum rubrum TaxID=1085 RepID=IF1_RHORT|nr:translation initiation factor IF-1 [Rhodospirillum rubrum]Q2RWM9.1 RecName: Full=Translation initiation factor IF-1 [Rhodospirillum rubrum ATCC 11170]ABC21466.1 bacterial translation initiation factor 1 (bIF-1) [Rhodospirillum rubrum ATCC 11170]AEO47148.1 translation initiation factor 1 [Rhodospirillum rubrum F11]MBK1665585.1 translation initiation factor IF-1 [Rhodospirillum rubrum]MBK1677697.1 translation initiation factor IF-1 [Rhodospirillum rubrum]QXG81141.1 translation initiation fac